MYAVQHKALVARHSPFGETELRNEWVDIITVGQLETEQAELTEARRIAARARGVYRDVRIRKSLPGGAGWKPVA